MFAKIAYNGVYTMDDNIQNRIEPTATPQAPQASTSIFRKFWTTVSGFILPRQSPTSNTQLESRAADASTQTVATDKTKSARSAHHAKVSTKKLGNNPKSQFPKSNVKFLETRETSTGPKRPMLSKAAQTTFIKTSDRSKFGFSSGGLLEKFQKLSEEDQRKVKNLFAKNMREAGVHSDKVSLSDGKEVVVWYEVLVANSQENFGQYKITAMQDC